MNPTLRTLSRLSVAVLALSALGAAPASAQAIGASFAKYGSKTGFSVSFGIGAPVAPAPYYYAPVRTWVPGHYEVRIEKFWVDGCERRVWIDAVHEWRRDYFGRLVLVCVRPGYWSVVRDAGHYESRRVRDWVPGRWSC